MFNTSSPAIWVDAAHKRYPTGVVALDDVTLRIDEGEFFALLGPNGAGKSTLINAMAGLLSLTRGRIEILGLDVRRKPRQAALNLGVVPQEITFDLFLTVRETLRYQSGYWGVSRNDVWIDELLDALDLRNKADTLVRQLSGGMKRRVLVAQALVHRPRIVVLDEPTAGVDVELRDNLWQLIGRLHAQGTTVVLTTHYLEEAQAMCSRVAIMQKGRVVALDRTEVLLEQANERRLVCRLTEGDVPSEIASLLVGRRGPELTFRAPDAPTAEQILGAFRRQGTPISSLQIREANLEDVFLRLTGKGGE